MGRGSSPHPFMVLLNSVLMGIGFGLGASIWTALVNLVRRKK